MPGDVLTVPLTFWTAEPGRRTLEPVSIGLPWPRGKVRNERYFRLTVPDGAANTFQTRVLDRWPDGSIRWCLFDFFASTPNGTTCGYSIIVGDAPADRMADMPVAAPADQPWTVDTGPATFTFAADGLAPLFTVACPGGPAAVHLRLHDELFERLPQELLWTVAERGPVRTRLAWSCLLFLEVGWLRAGGHIDCFAGSAAVRVQLTVRNPDPADHPGGNWDLGNGGSVYFDSLTWAIESVGDARPGETARVTVSPERGLPAVNVPGQLTLTQKSSGGDNWRSSVHLDRTGTIPMTDWGYTDDGKRITGGRATPVVGTTTGGAMYAVAVSEFWENFPKAIHASNGRLQLDLFPLTPGHPHELQGGEQKTHQFVCAFTADAISDPPLTWGRSPLVVTASPEWYARAGVVPYLTPRSGDPNTAHLTLADQAIEGPDTFVAKRERIDEYGWRNYGDIYGDHEAVYHAGPPPLVSHYNNQYDCVLAFAQQFLRSGDVRWWGQMLACATHTCDIDTYHTTGDKAAYNGGLFWHTYHYADAGTGTHRSYPKALRTGGHFTAGRDLSAMGDTGAALQKVYAVGGGPAGSHNYNAGLMLAYFLTGNTLYRDGAVGLADFVINMDVPRGGVFRLLSWQYTGLATESSAGYHGPGRASANSVLALLVGHQLTGDATYLDYCEMLIRRVSHPTQDLARLDLLNAELRWFYTMFLQALGVYLDYKIDLGRLDAMYAYGRETLLHYARWMAAHERPILDTPEALQYPTETWAAQDLRKVEVFQYAAKHAAGDDKAKFLERAAWFHQYCAAKLNEFETKSLCRPVILVMRYGWSHTWWQRHPEASAPPPAVAPADWGAWTPFVPQKVRAVRRAKQLVVLAAVGVVGLVVLRIAWLVGAFG